MYERGFDLYDRTSRYKLDGKLVPIFEWKGEKVIEINDRARELFMEQGDWQAKLLIQYMDNGRFTIYVPIGERYPMIRDEGKLPYSLYSRLDAILYDERNRERLIKGIAKEGNGRG